MYLEGTHASRKEIDLGEKNTHEKDVDDTRGWKTYEISTNDEINAGVMEIKSKTRRSRRYAQNLRDMAVFPG